MVDLLMDVMTNPDKKSCEENLIKWMNEKGTVDVQFTRLAVMRDVSAERDRQEQLKRDGKFTFTCADTEESALEKLPVLAEEFGEVAKEITEQLIELRKYQRDNLEYPLHRRIFRISELRKELIQVAAVCVAWCESLDKEQNV